jgi:hypothetical protein
MLGQNYLEVVIHLQCFSPARGEMEASKKNGERAGENWILSIQHCMDFNVKMACPINYAVATL